MIKSIHEEYDLVEFLDGDKLSPGLILVEDEQGKKYFAPEENFLHLHSLGFEKAKEQTE